MQCQPLCSQRAKCHRSKRNANERRRKSTHCQGAAGAAGGDATSTDGAGTAGGGAGKRKGRRRNGGSDDGLSDDEESSDDEEAVAARDCDGMDAEMRASAERFAVGAAGKGSKANHDASQQMFSALRRASSSYMGRMLQKYDGGSASRT